VCVAEVYALQSWKRPERPKIGKYGRQYVYVCPNTTCAHAVAEPFVLPCRVRDRLVRPWDADR
jgi:DNA (cytosine-5)-methyltransferase 1